MIYERNNEGYRDPTAGEALANIMCEEKKQHLNDLMRICGLAIRRKSVETMAVVTGFSPERVRNLLIELHAAVDRKCREACK